MVQKFQMEGERPTNHQVQRFCVDFIKNRITIYYHIDQDEIEPIKKIYQRETLIDLQPFGNKKSNSK